MKTNKIKVRRTWGELKPVTRRIESGKAYTRRGKFGNKDEN